ncbi:hypothetical protein GGQ67_004717, partial [Rhizobium metallidurans]|nr:hypothetical protein [Rhizobium metallidurans]
GLQVKTCSLSCSYRLHFLRSWSLRQTRCGSVLAVLSEFSKNVKGKQIDLSKTYTTEFVKNAK